MSRPTTAATSIAPAALPSMNARKLAEGSFSKKTGTAPRPVASAVAREAASSPSISYPMRARGKSPDQPRFATVPSHRGWPPERLP